jgi:uncharacterized PurR-regulated membrane protein YhhQ (DUF165 family)
VLVLANLMVFKTGQAALLLTGLILVPFDFAVRIQLQERWARSGVWIRLILLMVVGGVLTVLILPDARWVAIASVSAFVASSLAGALVYALLAHHEKRLARIASIGSMAALDSIVFPLLAFPEVSTGLMLAQCAMKWGAGLGFLAVLQRMNKEM